MIIKNIKYCNKIYCPEVKSQDGSESNLRYFENIKQYILYEIYLFTTTITRVFLKQITIIRKILSLFDEVFWIGIRQNIKTVVYSCLFEDKSNYRLVHLIFIKYLLFIEREKFKYKKTETVVIHFLRYPPIY